MDAAPKTLTEVPADTPTVAHERFVDAAPEEAWAAWTRPELIARWWGPDGFTTTIHEMDVRPGGVFRFIMHGPDGTDYPNRVSYREAAPMRRLAYRHDGGFDNDPMGFDVEIVFTARDGGTLIRMQSRFASMDARDAIKAFNAIELGRQTMEKMAAFIEKRSAR